MRFTGKAPILARGVEVVETQFPEIELELRITGDTLKEVKVRAERVIEAATTIITEVENLRW